MYEYHYTTTLTHTDVFVLFSFYVHFMFIFAQFLEFADQKEGWSVDQYSAMKTPESTDVSYFCLRKRKVLSVDLSAPVSAAHGQWLAGEAGSVEERIARIVEEAREATADAQRARAELAKVRHKSHTAHLALHICTRAHLYTVHHTLYIVLHCIIGNRTHYYQI